MGKHRGNSKGCLSKLFLLIFLSLFDDNNNRSAFKEVSEDVCKWVSRGIENVKKKIFRPKLVNSSVIKV